MVKKKTIVAMLMFVAWLMPAIAFADSYSSMWKQWSKMNGRDLPKSELAVLQKIVDKATAERAYGHLLKAQVLTIDAQISVSPDSLRSLSNESTDRRYFDLRSSVTLFGLCSFSNKRAVTHDACRLPAFS